jgi:sulfatase maturation enzyme AslB (radical SAM superfamily)
MASKWCSFPFKGVLTENDGTFTTCCHGKTAIDYKTGKPMTRETHSIKEVFDSEYFERIRQNLLNGVEDPNCDYCWELERQGVESFRQISNTLLQHEEHGDTDPRIEILDLSLGNQCNLKCRTCIPEDSSLWVKEAYDTDYVGELTLKDYQKKIIFLEPEDSKFVKDIKDSLKDVRLIKFFGGEPFMMKRTWDIISEAVTIGRDKIIELYFNTNGTFWDKDRIALFENFEKVNIALSIDGVGSRFEYMRHPAKWTVVEDNIKKISAWSKLKPNRELFLTHTVSAYNIWYVHDAVELARTYGLKLYINPCLLESDSFAVRYIPLDVKAVVDKHLVSFDYTQDELAEIKKLVDYTPEGSDWKEWIAECAKRDKYRNESFKHTFPEYYQILKDLGKLDDTSI